MFDKGEYDDAIAIYKNIEKVRLEIRGEKDLHYLTTMHNLALCLQYKGKCNSYLQRESAIGNTWGETPSLLCQKAQVGFMS